VRLTFLFPCSLLPWFPVFRPQRISEKGVQDVGEQQFLVLLLVVHSKLDAAQRLRFRLPLQQALYCSIYMLAVAQNLIEPRPRKRRPQPFLGKCRETLVIAIEEPRKVCVEDPVIGQNSRTTNDSKNHVVWARCHLAGEASGHDCTIMSSA